jgi:hypothetical protein
MAVLHLFKGSSWTDIFLLPSSEAPQTPPTPSLTIKERTGKEVLDKSRQRCSVNKGVAA